MIPDPRDDDDDDDRDESPNPRRIGRPIDSPSAPLPPFLDPGPLQPLPRPFPRDKS